VPRPRISDRARDRIVQLAKQGHPQAAIALQLVTEGLVEKISQSAISKILSARKAAGEKIAHRTRPDPRTAARRRLAAQARADDEGPAPMRPDEMAALPEQLRLTDDDELGSVEHLRRRLAEVSRMIAEAKSAGELGNPALFRDLVKLEAYLTQQVLALTPKPPPDPAQDPTNVAAKRALIAKVERLIQHEEKACQP
jgi:hypothetical protein